MLVWALRYARLGWPVFPLAVRSKIPLIPKSQGGNGCRDATLNESKIREWWKLSPDSNIGIATGHRFFVLDVDLSKGGDETWDMLRLQHGRPPDTIEQITGTGGKHLLYQMPEFQVKNSESKIGQGLDIRGVGGYIVGAPSIHPQTGRAYDWDGLAEIEQQSIAEAPAWLLRLIQESERRPADNKATPEIIGAGGRNDTLFRAGCRLRRDGWTEDEIFASLREINRRRCQPPLPDNEIRTIAHSCGTRYKPDKRANVFRNRREESTAAAVAIAAGPLSQPEIEAAIQNAIDRNDLKAAVDLAPQIAALTLDAQALVTAKLSAHFDDRFPKAQFDAVLRSGRVDELELAQADVEAGARAAIELNDLSAAVELAPHVGKLPRDVQALITMRLRAHFGDRFPTKQFETVLKSGSGSNLIQMPPPPAGKPPGEDDDNSDDGPNLLRYPLTDSGNGERFVALFGSQVRYCIEMEKFLVWDGKRWSIDDRKAVTQLAKRTARRLYEQATGRPEFEKWARKSESAAGIDAMLRRAATEPGMPISAPDLDRHPYLYNCSNGVIDLRSRKLLPHDRKYMITKLCAVEYKPDATCPRFMGFIHWAMGDTNPDAEPLPRTLRMVSFLQRIFGYSLTADVSEKCVFIFYGPTADNGKTTLVEVIKGICGPDYSAVISIRSLMTTRMNEAGSDLADLRGARVASASESQEGESLNEAQLKMITSGTGEIKARKLYENFIRFPQTHHLFIDCNHRPRVSGTDRGIWNRLMLIPFNSHIDKPDQDKELKDKLLAEAQGILAWIVRGSAEWIEKKNLDVPGEVVSETKAWEENDDPLREFLQDCCEVEEGRWEQCVRISAAYVWWCKQNNEKFGIGRSRFMERMRTKGFRENRGRRDQAKQLRTWEGLALKDHIWSEIAAQESKFKGSSTFITD